MADAVYDDEALARDVAAGCSDLPAVAVGLARAYVAAAGGTLEDRHGGVVTPDRVAAAADTPLGAWLAGMTLAEVDELADALLAELQRRS